MYGRDKDIAIVTAFGKIFTAAHTAAGHVCGLLTILCMSIISRPIRLTSPSRTAMRRGTRDIYIYIRIIVDDVVLSRPTWDPSTSSR